MTQAWGLSTEPDRSSVLIPQSAENEPPGAVAQLGEHLLCKQRVVGSIPISSTIFSLRTTSIRVDDPNRPRAFASPPKSAAGTHG
jgi:hypothetical protein